MYRVRFSALARGIVVLAVLVSTGIATASAAPSSVSELTPREAVLSWIAAYRAKPALAQVPAAVRAASKFGAFRDVDSAGVYVGFIAGVFASNPAKSEELVVKMLSLPPEEHWVIVRAVAYSGLPQWKQLLGKVAARMPGRKIMVEKYLAGKLPTLDQFAFQEEPNILVRMRDALTLKSALGDEAAKQPSFDPHPDLIDTYWGYYYATGTYSPVARIVAMLAWAKERNSIAKLTLGSMAKHTLSVNAARDPALLSLLKWARTQQPKNTAAELDEVIEAAETADTPRLRKQALDAIEELKRKGPGFKRDVSLWGQVGQGALSLGCIGLAVAGQVALGVPCVVGGALSSGFLYYWGQQQ